MSSYKEFVQSSVLQRLEQIRNFIKSINQCALCAEPLTLIHEINQESNQVLETAHCSKCNMNSRVKDHALH
ncbi:MAG: hypothetical protein K2Q26_03115 [Bdellovibrionales bacterium]|nr:hypothetical protein [Bdellovibrionales bacterium]